MRVTWVRPARSHRVAIGVVYETKVASRSEPGVQRTVRRQANGSWECDCPGFHYHEHCVHADAEREAWRSRGKALLGELL